MNYPSTTSINSELLIENVSLGERDSQLYYIESQIESKRKLLIEKRKYLQKTIEENNFLEGVKNDYEKYNNYIITQKKDQIHAMSILKQYIEDIITSGKLTDNDIKESKKEQQELLREIENIKKNLDELI
jgi:hypothetical protein